MQPSVRRTADEHGADGEDFLSIGVGTDIAKAHTGQAAEGKVEGSDVGAAHCRAAHCAVDIGCLQTFAQLMEPPLKEEVEQKNRERGTMSSDYSARGPCVLGGLRTRWQWQSGTTIPGLRETKVYVCQKEFSGVSPGCHAGVRQGEIRLAPPGINKAEC